MPNFTFYQKNQRQLFSLFNKKTRLRDLIPDGHIDIHSHLLPGIDDGSKSFADTMNLITSMQQFGFRQFITTPHVMKNVWENTASGIKTTLAETRQELAQAGNAAPLNAAAEYLLDNNFMELFRSEPLLTLKDNYVLVEMSYLNAPIQLYDIIFEVQIAGYVPVLAHPERYSFYYSNFGEYTKLKNAGCLLQLNLLSTVGYYGPGVFETAKKLLQAGMIDYTGSDVHHENHIRAFDKRVYLKDTKALEEAIARNQFFRF
jgi:protein-tyrosine phosphatase